MVTETVECVTPAVRSWPGWSREPATPRGQRSRAPKPIENLLIFDTETTTDRYQNLTFGSARHCVRTGAGEIVTLAEVMFHADDLPESDPAGYQVLSEYGADPRNSADVTMDYVGAVMPDPVLHLLPLSDFLEWFYRLAYKQKATVVGFNLKFDLSRIASGAGEARSRGGFSFKLWTDADGNNLSYRPRLVVTPLGPRKSLIRFTGVERGARAYRGRFLDIGTLIFALRNRSYGLKAACEDWHVTAKSDTDTHGIITRDYVDYNRNDVLSTVELTEAVLREHDSHPVNLDPCNAFSPASVAKAYLRALGVLPVHEKDPNFPDELNGYAMSAFYGGRAESRFTRVPLPVYLLDFTSMYPTVNSLLGLWELLIAKHIIPQNNTETVQGLLDGITLEDCFRKETWPGLVGIARIIPDGETLPVRAQYDPTENGHQIGLNQFESEQSYWYTIPDLVAAKILSGKTPRVLEAWTFHASPEKLDTLRTVALRGEVPIDPRADDLYRVVIEQRLLRGDAGKNDATGYFLKILANSGSYGIFAEMNVHEGEPDDMTIHGPDAQPFTVPVDNPEQPGTYCFPPVAACITGAARLMLALAERLVTHAGGAWVFCDTDSMAVVAAEHGGIFPCPGEAETTADGREGIRALTGQQIQEIRDRFRPLNPYAPAAFAGKPESERTILGIDQTGWCYSVAAKRYAIYDLGNDGRPCVTKASELVLGSYLPPDDRNSRQWIRELWEAILRDEYGLAYEEPDWFKQPAVVQLSVSTPHMWHAFRHWNDGQPWARQVKPFGFVMKATWTRHGELWEQPLFLANAGALIAPYESDRDRWHDIGWRFLRSSDAEIVDDPRVMTYRNLKLRHPKKAETKYAGRDGKRCQENTIGRLSRRRVHGGKPDLIGKETHRLDEKEAGLSTHAETLNSFSSVDTWRELVLPALEPLTNREIVDRIEHDSMHTANFPASGVTVTTKHLARLRSGKRFPSREMFAALKWVAAQNASRELRSQLRVDTRRPDLHPDDALLHYRRLRGELHGKLCACGCGRPTRRKWASEGCRAKNRERVYLPGVGHLAISDVYSVLTTKGEIWIEAHQLNASEVNLITEHRREAEALLNGQPHHLSEYAGYLVGGWELESRPHKVGEIVLQGEKDDGMPSNPG